ncbi:MAG: hypothetical protein ACE5FY_05750 [Nitrospiria bacterium]
MKVLLFFFMFFVGCAQTSPLLLPAGRGPTALSQEVIRVIIKPIATQGIGSEDEKKWKLDISDYFTAFQVTILNDTKKDIFFEPVQSNLLTEGGGKYQALDAEESINYYRDEGDLSRITLIPKSIIKVDRETRILKKVRSRDGLIRPGDQNKGLIFFKKVSQDRCTKIVLEIEGISVVETGEKKLFSFPLSCKVEK